MEERNKISEIHRIVMNYWKMTTASNFSNEEDEKSYTQGVLDEINEIVNLLPIHDVIQSDYLCDRECSGENKCDEQCYMCADMEKHSV